MKRDVLETYLGKNVNVTIFDGSTYKGYLRKTGDEEFKHDANLYIPVNLYFITETKESKQCISCLFRVSHIKELKQFNSERKWNKQGRPRPYELVEIMTNDYVIHADMLIKGKFGVITWRNFDDKFILAWRPLK